MWDDCKYSNVEGSGSPSEFLFYSNKNISNTCFSNANQYSGIITLSH